MATRRAWESLSEAYRSRLFRSGITATDYASGASLKAARGHAVTPERPKQAFRNPDLFGDYLRRRVAKGRDVPPDVISRPRPSRRDDDTGPRDSPSISDSIGWPGRETITTITFFRSPGGAKAGDQGIMTVTEIGPDGRVVNVRTFTYNQADFYTLIDLARKRGFSATVESSPLGALTA